MIDIVSVGSDLGLFDTDVEKAKNIASTQLASLEYLKDFGIDLKFFLDEKYRFQNESFKAYIVERLTNSGINVAQVFETVENLYVNYVFSVGSEGTGNSGSLVAR